MTQPDLSMSLRTQRNNLLSPGPRAVCDWWPVPRATSPRPRDTPKDARYRGTTLAEAAIVFPLLLLVTLGALQYGWAFVNLHRITNAARHGARIAAAWGATDEEGEAAIRALVGDMAGAEPLVITDHKLATVTATVTVPRTSVQLIPWNLLPLPEHLQRAVKMAKEGGAS